MLQYMIPYYTILYYTILYYTILSFLKIGAAAVVEVVPRVTDGTGTHVQTNIYYKKTYKKQL